MQNNAANSQFQSLHLKASTAYENNDIDEALRLYNEIIKLSPADEVALSCVMDIYNEKDDKFNYYLARANVNIAQNKLEYAINDTKKAIALDIDNVDARRKLSRLYKVAGKNLKAIDEFLRLLEISPKEIDAYFELVELYMQENSIESAISIARRALDEFEDNANVKNMLAQLYFRSNDFKQALEVVQDDFLRIKILLQDEQNDKAHEYLEKYDVNSLNEVQRVSYRILNAQYFYNINEYEKALKEIEKYVNFVGPDALSFQMKALIYEGLNDEFNSHLNWGFCYRLQGKLDDAIVEFTNAYHIKEDDKTVLIELAKLYQHNKERFVAIEFWEKVYAIDQDQEAKEILAEFYYSEGNFEKAEEYGKVVEHQEENYTGLIDKIMAFFSKDK